MSESEQITILAVGAHPDDVEFGCGGILLKEAALGASIHILVCSKGEAGSNGSPEKRMAECKSAALHLGATLHFIECGGDGRIVATKENALALAQILRVVRPDIVLTPSLITDQHPDHASIGAATRDAARLARYAGLEPLRDRPAHTIRSLFYYAVTPGGEPETGTPLLVDISAQRSDWIALMECHDSQMKTRRYVDMQVARARVLGLQAGGEYAQALWSNDRMLIDSLRSAPVGVRTF